MRNKLIVFGVALLVAATFGVIQLSAEAAPSCDKVNIVYCGLNGSSTSAQISSLRSYYNKGADTTNPHGTYKDLKAIYNWAGANQTMINGMNTSNTKRGTLHRSNGTIVVGGRTVGTHAAMAARYSSGSGYSKITSHAWSRSVSPSHNTESTYEVLVYFDKNGKADFAVAIDCANAVRFTPTPPPKPQPKPVAACQGINVIKKSDTSFTISGKASASHGAKVKSYTFRIYNPAHKVVLTKTIKTSSLSTSFTYNQKTPGTYAAAVWVNTNIGTKADKNKCSTSFTVPKPPTPPKPVYTCDSTEAEKISRTKVKFSTTYTAKHATYKSTEYVIRDSSGHEIDRTSSTTYEQTKTGNYTVQAYVTFKVNGKTKVVTSKNCKAGFEVPKPKTPAISIEKTVDGQKFEKVGVDQKFTYELVVTNTGEVDLKNAVVTDNAPQGVTFLDASAGDIKDNKWIYTIPELKVGDSTTVTITAKVPAFLAGKIKNTACVDTPEVPGSPDDCSHATVEVPGCPAPGKENLPENSPECEETPPVTPPTTPPELPHTGASDVILSLLGAGSLIGAISYYVASRRA